MVNYIYIYLQGCPVEIQTAALWYLIGRSMAALPLALSPCSTVHHIRFTTFFFFREEKTRRSFKNAVFQTFTLLKLSMSEIPLL
jgi:hypothetical protein